MGKRNKTPGKNSPAPETLATNKKKGKGKKQEIPKDEKARRQANRAKVSSTINWTGKLPHMLLHEACQKRKWNKVEYEMKKIGDKGMLAIAVLSRTDPKSKDVLSVRMNDPTYNKTTGKGVQVPQETSMEARNLAATVALYRISFNTNLHMMLPPNHRKVWHELEDYRKSLIKENCQKAHRLFDLDPFKTLMEEEKRKERGFKTVEEKNKRAPEQSMLTTLTSLDASCKERAIENSKNKAHKCTTTTADATTVVTFPRKAWDSAAFVDLEESLRCKIEASAKLCIDWNRKRVKSRDAIASPSKYALRNKLLTLGFRPSHVEESLTYQDPLSFLFFHLPEDDLPPYFHKRREDSKNTVEITSMPLDVRNKIDRLSESGVSKDEAALVLQSCDMNENEAAGKLTAAIVPSVDPSAKALTPEVESLEIWSQELESLQSMYPESVQILRPDCCYMIDLKIFKSKLKVYRTRHYPSVLPGIIVSTFDRHYKLPDYIKEKILRNLLQYVVDSNLLGEMLVFHLCSWLQDNLKAIVANPGPLLSERELLASSNNTKQIRTAPYENNKENLNRRHASSTLDGEEISALKQEYLHRISTSRYKSMLDVRALLPAWNKKNIIVDLVKSHAITLITGETGSGKSTQVVQFLLDMLLFGENDDFGNSKIICTQPRRISAIGLAERVSDERCVKCGDEVGYIIRGTNRSSKKTKIRFITTGILVRILQTDTSFLKNSILVIDEVHERSLDTDLIVMLLKGLRERISGLKVVLMSATVNVEIFKKYFDGLGTCHIEGRTFPIKDYYLDEILEMVDFKIKADEFRKYRSDHDVKEETQYIWPTADSKFFKSGQINYHLVSEVVKHIDRELDLQNNSGSIIVFLPGVAEINRCCHMLEASEISKKLEILPLHSSLTPEDQKMVFRNYGSKRKVIVSTNISETSITISDCVATIDTGRVKTMIYNPADNTTRLTETFISKAEANQRRGRAGRVCNGVSYKLFSKRLYEEDMVPMPIPEIKRVSLESLYLSVKSMGINDVHGFLANGLDPPPLRTLEKASDMLTTMGLLNEYDDSLTELGRLITMMPVMDSKHGKLLIYSIIFGIMDIGILLASILSVGTSPFINDINLRGKIKSLLQKYESRGDLLATAEILRQYMQIQDSSTSKNHFLREYCLSYNKVRDIISCRTQFYSILKDIGFLSFKSDPKTNSSLNRNNNNIAIIKAILTGASYPHVARVQLPNPKYMATNVGAIEKDPEAKAIKYWIRNDEYIDALRNLPLIKERPLPAKRAFIHPSSILFTSKGSANSQDAMTLNEVDENSAKKYYNSTTVSKFPFIVFNSSQVTTKLFIRQITPSSTLSLLLFGGPLSYDINANEHSPGIIVDQWLPIRTWCKNGVLIKELRSLLDQAIKDKLENTKSGNNASSTILNLVEEVITLE